MRKVTVKERNGQADLLKKEEIASHEKNLGGLNSSKCGAMILLINPSTKLAVSICRDLRGVRTGVPKCPLNSGQKPEILQKTNRGVLRRIRRESLKDMQCRVRWVRLSQWILVPSIGKYERLAVSKRGQVS